ncbi:MAG: NAD(P)-binding protein [Ignavibacteriaceae bacterium]|nr:FAD-dependent oxidoreductase [Ignavibacteria bacterium]MBT8392256.1 FAD-dependent oxidoreductase [Ignavibacteria bacterium]NNJ52499.1 NAD(P)-binding protein [Ignavibacteriaceae bacterium]NNL21793.1 NAD(P)-binding protein [Ignavibacteriaceae bacterium]
MSIKSIISKRIEKKLGGYKIQLNKIDSVLPEKLSNEKSVGIIGGGLAGVSAAIFLAERGFAVKIFEKEKYLGGKVGSWPVSFEDGFSTNVEHGFHAFFRQYYNLRNLLKKIDAFKYLIPIDDYLILTKDYGNFGFKDISTVPILNILSMAKTGIYSYKDAMLNPGFRKMTSLLSYNREKTFSIFDKVSFKDFANEVKLPPEMQLMFTTFSRAFFAEPQYISMAELIKSFHSYFLSNDLGLLYDVLNDDFEDTLWNPAKEYLSKYKSSILLDSKITSFRKDGNQFIINNEQFDYAIIASDVKGTKNIIQNSDYFKNEHHEFYNQIINLKQSQRYSVLRVWIDKDIRQGVPFFIFTDALEILDSVTIYHRMEKTSEDWVKKNGGGIFELHSYALPDDFPEAEVRNQFLKEFEEYFPEIKGYKIKYEYLQVKDDFTAFHTNLYKNRPTVKANVNNLFLAGDWVKLESPAMLMEAATTSALYCANKIIEQEGLQQETIFSVPLKGILS